MAEPDELYTLRAQFWLGHYNLALEEAKAIARRPMSPILKAEREEFILRSHMALGNYDKVTAAPDSSPAIKVLKLRALYECSSDDEAAQQKAVDDIKSVLAEQASNTGVQLTAAHVFLQAGLTREALQCVHLGLTMEHLCLCLQIYIKIDRLDLAAEQLSLMRQGDEDAVLTQLGAVFVDIATGSSTAADAVHHLNSMSEQYGPSPLLLNLMACSYMASGDFDAAEGSLKDCLREFPEDADTLVNLVVCYQHQGKGMTAISPVLAKLKSNFPNHSFCQGLERVEGAFDREAIKYKVSA